MENRDEYEYTEKRCNLNLSFDDFQWPFLNEILRITNKAAKHWKT